MLGVSCLKTCTLWPTDKEAALQVEGVPKIIIEKQSFNMLHAGERRHTVPNLASFSQKV